MSEKLFVDYPVAKTINEAIEWMQNGGEVWQEIEEDYPDCGGFDDVECLMDNFPESEFDYNEDITDYNLHLVPKK